MLKWISDKVIAIFQLIKSKITFARLAVTAWFAMVVFMAVFLFNNGASIGRSSPTAEQRLVQSKENLTSVLPKDAKIIEHLGNHKWLVEYKSNRYICWTNDWNLQMVPFVEK